MLKESQMKMIKYWSFHPSDIFYLINLFIYFCLLGKKWCSVLQDVFVLITCQVIPDRDMVLAHLFEIYSQKMSPKNTASQNGVA